MGAGASWLLPAALVLLGVLLWRTRQAPRTDPLRAAIVLWGGWLLITGLVFSFMAGIIHPYYTVAIAPAVAALVGLGATQLWRDRATLTSRVTLAAVLALTVGWAWYLLAQTTWQPWARRSDGWRSSRAGWPAWSRTCCCSPGSTPAGRWPRIRST